ncbi:META domain-containing protein [Kribbella ginsengisoli]|uniref:META domain-containing protein n=1 Tax=Kribbella ginsengisoli TaxID=363865 RepID=UPI0031DA1AF2
MRIVVAAVAGVMMLTACGSEPSTGGPGGGGSTSSGPTSSAPGGGGSLDGRSFLSVSVTEDGKPKELAPKTRIGLRFADGNVHAETGCNQVGGEVSTAGGKLTIDVLGGTEMGCDTPRQEQQYWVEQLLKDRPTWKLDADTLTLTRGTTTVVLKDRKVVQPDKVLDGTRWSLETVVEGGDTEWHLVGSEKAHLTISGERITGFTGCNDFQGVVATTGNQLTFSDLVSTQKACAGDDGKLEKAFVTTLKGQVTYTIEANRLQLRAADGNGLDLTAR